MKKEEIDLHVRILKSKTSRKRKREGSAGVLFKYIYPKVNNLIRKKIYHAEMVVDAEDITMMAMGKAFESIKQYDPQRTAFSTWVCTIAVNTLVDQIRKRKKDFIVQYEEIGYVHCHNYSGTVFDQTGGLPTGIDILIMEDVKGQVQYHLSQVKNPRNRKAIELFYLKQLKYKEIAVKMYSSMGLVKTMIHRGMQEVKLSAP